MIKAIIIKATIKVKAFLIKRKRWELACKVRQFERWVSGEPKIKSPTQEEIITKVTLSSFRVMANLKKGSVLDVNSDIVKAALKSHLSLFNSKPSGKYINLKDITN